MALVAVPRLLHASTAAVHRGRVGARYPALIVFVSAILQMHARAGNGGSGAPCAGAVAAAAAAGALPAATTLPALLALGAASAVHAAAVQAGSAPSPSRSSSGGGGGGGGSGGGKPFLRCWRWERLLPCMLRRSRREARLRPPSYKPVAVPSADTALPENLLFYSHGKFAHKKARFAAAKVLGSLEIYPLAQASPPSPPEAGTPEHEFNQRFGGKVPLSCVADVLYRLHPDKSRYIPVHDYNNRVLRDALMRLVKLLRDGGAKEIIVDKRGFEAVVRGNEQSLGVEVPAAVPIAGAVEAAHESRHERETRSDAQVSLTVATPTAAPAFTEDHTGAWYLEGDGQRIYEVALTNIANPGKTRRLTLTFGLGQRAVDTRSLLASAAKLIGVAAISDETQEHAASIKFDVVFFSEEEHQNTLRNREPHQHLRRNSEVAMSNFASNRFALLPSSNSSNAEFQATAIAFGAALPSIPETAVAGRMSKIAAKVKPVETSQMNWFRRLARFIWTCPQTTTMDVPIVFYGPGLQDRSDSDTRSFNLVQRVIFTICAALDGNEYDFRRMGRSNWSRILTGSMSFDTMLFQTSFDTDIAWRRERALAARIEESDLARNNSDSTAMDVPIVFYGPGLQDCSNRNGRSVNLVQRVIFTICAALDGNEYDFRRMGHSNWSRTLTMSMSQSTVLFRTSFDTETERRREGSEFGAIEESDLARNNSDSTANFRLLAAGQAVSFDHDVGGGAFPFGVPILVLDIEEVMRMMTLAMECGDNVSDELLDYFDKMLLLMGDRQSIREDVSGHARLSRHERLNGERFPPAYVFLVGDFQPGETPTGGEYPWKLATKWFTWLFSVECVELPLFFPPTSASNMIVKTPGWDDKCAHIIEKWTSALEVIASREFKVWHALHRLSMTLESMDVFLTEAERLLHVEFERTRAAATGNAPTAPLSPRDRKRQMFELACHMVNKAL
eukprot:CAMPEP_0202093284 /NCGR_PEP_ID=MMETSP0964-20121228/48462_1 /ASSEMBLY_ACC=CAM_ASM_000500 /TAXON_ID=4773 /ORGANISM="Schizochytrium aggregatum, Strain ATCC28209" /LENGTH=957 /DNA_ID=CAMNT_0048661533 /DNA_START=592 /DNA_END=3467 /DNA_ORIENTATION=+